MIKNLKSNPYLKNLKKLDKKMKAILTKPELEEMIAEKKYELNNS